MAGIEEQLEKASIDVLVNIVRVVQGKGMEGERGNWKQFLDSYDKRFGSGVSDPAKRKPAELMAFLKTFKKEDDLEILGNILRSRSNLVVAKAVCRGADSPEERLVSLTVGHPRYSSDYAFPSHEEGWLVTKHRKKRKERNSNNMIAVDCEMVLCEDWTEAVVKICVVDRDLQVKLHEFVKPDKAVKDYRTSITGVTAEDLDGVTTSMATIQRSMKRLLSNGTILVGHSLHNDLNALKIQHARVIDTALIFKYGDEPARRRVSLNDLCQSVLGFEVRKMGEAHNCLDDACAAMKLVLAKIQGGFDVVVPTAKSDVPEVELSRLFIHRIPISHPSEKLHQIIPGEYTIDVQDAKKAKVIYYSAYLNFKSPEEALQAYEKVEGNEEKDIKGRSQKSVNIWLNSGSTDKLYVRKMAPNDQLSALLRKKRPREAEVEAEDSSGVPKKLKEEEHKEADDGACVGHLQEIEKLNKLLALRDKEITNLHKIIAALTRKQGL